MRPNHIKLLKFINEKDTIPLSEISELLNWSRYKINKYISEINNYFKKMEYNLEIVQQPRIGISLKGSSSEKDNLLNSMNYLEDTENDRRIIKTLSALLNAKDWLTIQEMADDLYISKSTFEQVLKDVRGLLKSYGLEIDGSKNGIKLDTTEENKRKLIGKIISTYKNKLVAFSNPKEELELSIKMSDDLNQFINNDVINRVADVLVNFSKNTKLYLTEYEFNTLAIHIAISIERIEKEFIVNRAINKIILENNTLLLVDNIEKEFSITLPKYETEYINIHILSIQTNAYNGTEYGERSKLTNDGVQFKDINILLEKILTDIEPDQELVKGLTLHLKSAINRLSNNISIRNPYLDEIKSNFMQAFEMSKEFVFQIESEYNIKFDEDEIAYVAMHIQSFLERERAENKRNVILVCGSGYGTAKLLEQRLLTVFGNKLNIVNRIGISELDKVIKNDELVITTVPIENHFQNNVYVSPLLTEDDILRINNKLSVGQSKENSFINLLSKDYFEISDKDLSQTEIINKMVTKITTHDFATDDLYTRVMNRERLSTTAIRNFAMPHAEISKEDEPLIYVYINQNGIDWAEDEVTIVFLFLLNEKVKDELDNIYEFFYKIISSEITLHSLVNVNNFEDFIQILRRVI